MRSSLQKIFLSILLLNVAFSNCELLGPADIEIKRLETCDDVQGEGVAVLTPKMHRINRTHMGLDYYMNMPTDFDDTVFINVSFSKWGDGGWKPNYLNVKDGRGCKFLMMHIKDQLMDFMKMNGQSPQCPLKAGEFNGKNYIINTDFNKPAMYGDFKGRLEFSKKDKIFLCIIAYAKSSPKSSTKVPKFV